MPVSHGDEVVAIIALNGCAPFVLSDEDQEVLSSLVAQAAVAIRNAHLFAEADERRRAAEAAETRYRELFDRNLAGILRPLEAVEREAETLRAVARLANVAAHEINNPLAVIIGYLTLLEQRLAADADAAQRMASARRACGSPR